MKLKSLLQVQKVLKLSQEKLLNDKSVISRQVVVCEWLRLIPYFKCL